MWRNEVGVVAGPGPDATEEGENFHLFHVDISCGLVVRLTVDFMLILCKINVISCHLVLLVQMTLTVQLPGYLR